MVPLGVCLTIRDSWLMPRGHYLMIHDPRLIPHHHGARLIQGTAVTYSVTGTTAPRSRHSGTGPTVTGRRGSGTGPRCGAAPVVPYAAELLVYKATGGVSGENRFSL